MIKKKKETLSFPEISFFKCKKKNAMEIWALVSCLYFLLENIALFFKSVICRKILRKLKAFHRINRVLLLAFIYHCDEQKQNSYLFHSITQVSIGHLYLKIR